MRLPESGAASTVQPWQRRFAGSQSLPRIVLPFRLACVGVRSRRSTARQSLAVFGAQGRRRRRWRPGRLRPVLRASRRADARRAAKARNRLRERLQRIRFVARRILAPLVCVAVYLNTEVTMPAKGHKQTPEARAKIAAALRGRPLSPEHRATLSRARRGVPKSKAHREAIARGVRLAIAKKAALEAGQTPAGEESC